MNPCLSRLAAAIGVTLACGGCGSADDGAPVPPANMHVGGQTGGEAGIRCSDSVTVTALAFDTASPLGFSAQDVAAALPAHVARPLAWTDGSSAVLDLEVAFTGSAGYAAACHSQAADVTLSLTSSDQALVDSVPGRLFSSALDRATLDVNLTPNALSGALATVHPSLVAGASGVSVLVDFAGNTASGRVLASGTEGDAEIAAF